MTLSSGQVLQSRYRIVKLLGQGGMGAVYRTWDTRLDVPVALKEMIPQPGLDAQTLSQLRHQFQQEANTLARLSHPHLVRVTDFFQEHGNAYLVMNFVEGESLAERIRRQGALSEDQVVTWGEHLLDALAYCHDQGIIHRDVKPQNVIIRPDGQAVLVDFGLVKLWDPEDPVTRTAMRGMGTPQYAPPEQYGVALGHTDARSDIYSLGATLYHALTGQTPPTATQRTAKQRSLRSPRLVNPYVSLATDAALMQAMELGMEDRFPSAREMAAALRSRPITNSQAPSGQHAAKSRPRRPSVVSPVRRVPLWAWGLGGVALLILTTAAFVVAVSQLGRSDERRASVGTSTSVAVHDTPTSTPSPIPSTAPTVEALPPATDVPIVESDPTATVAPTPLPSVIPQSETLVALPPNEAECGDEWIRPKDKATMVYVPGVSFTMGSDTGEGDERPPHQVYLDSFWIDRFEITNAAFEQFILETGYQTDAEKEGWGSIWQNGQWNRVNGLDWRHPHQLNQGISAIMDHPVVQVSWNDAGAYCAWVGGRLPTEAEWEMAAVGETGWRYPWGDSFDPARLNASGEGTVRVGSYPEGRSPCGVYDMAGNVWEWVSDWYQSDYYAVSPSSNPRGPENGSYKVLRGGGWDPSGGDSRSADRGALAPGNRGDTIGFRCAWGSDASSPAGADEDVLPTSTPACPPVQGAFADVWREVQEEVGCATGSPLTGQVVEENFQGGKMFWREPVDYAQALVLYDDGTWKIVQHSPFVEGSPEFSCPDADTPSRCPPTPKRGFGLIWCDISEVRSRLGDAIDCERSYHGSTQEFERGSMLQTDSGAIYILYDAGHWERQ